MTQEVDASQKGDNFKDLLYKKIARQFNEYIIMSNKKLENIDLSKINRHIIDINVSNTKNNTLGKLSVYKSCVDQYCLPDSIGISTSTVLNLSKNGRIVLSRSMDILESIDIGCFYPEQIEFVTLFASIRLPSDLTTIDLDTFDFKDFMKDIDKYNSYSDIHYIPLKVYTGTHIEIPLNLAYLIYTQFSIEVKFSDIYTQRMDMKCLLQDGYFCVKLNGIVLDNKYRRSIMNPLTSIMNPLTSIITSHQ